MDKQSRLIKTIEFKQRNQMDITQERQELIAANIKLDQTNIVPHLFLPEDCITGDALARLKHKTAFLKQEFNRYISLQGLVKAKQLEYLADIASSMFVEEQEIYFDQFGGASIPLEDPRYKTQLFKANGANEHAVIICFNELWLDLTQAITQSPEDIYIAINNLSAFLLAACLELAYPVISQDIQ